MITRRQFLAGSAALATGALFPSLTRAAGSLKCVAGWPGWTRCQQVGAHFGYQWDNPDPAYGRIPHVKVGWDKPWTGESAIRAAARSGAIMVCNEMTINKWSPDQQVDVLHRLFSVIHDENPACYVLGPNDVVWEPYNGWAGYHNIEAVANRYAQRYGHVPPFRGFGFHAYYYPGRADLTNMIYWAAEEARRVYGHDIDCHITETGSLVGEQAAIDSIPYILDGLNVGIAAWFWFISHDDPNWKQHPACRIYDPGWSLTRVGRAYRDL